MRSSHALGFLAVGALLPVSAFASPAQASPRNDPPQPYVDRLIDGGNLAPLTVSADEQSENTSGNLRSVVVELGGSVISPKSRISGTNTSMPDRVQREAGLAVSGRYQTDNFGLLSLDAQLHRGMQSGPLNSASKGSSNGSVTFGSRDLPLGDGWLADTALGMTTTPTIALVRRQTRFYLPTMPILGASMTFKAFRRYSPQQSTIDPEPVASFNLAVGEPGSLGGLRLSDFTGLSGIAVSAGGQLDLSHGWSAGVQAIAVKNSRDPYAGIFQSTPSSDSPPLASSQGALGSIAFSRAGMRVQANAIWSRRTGANDGSSLLGRNGKATGGWVDGSYRAGKAHHSGGIYYFGPGLSWGTSALISNVYGGYYRFSTSSQRWRWTVNLDAIESIELGGQGTVIANADIRRKIGFTTAIGLNGTVRVANGQTASRISGYIDFSTRMGSSRAEAGWGNDPLSDLYRIGFSQSWALPASFPSGSRLSTQLAYEIRRQSRAAPYLPDRSLAERASSFGAAVSAGAAPFNGFSFDATLAYNSNSSSSAASVYGPVDFPANLSSEQGRAFSASIVATARLSSNWSLSASYTDTTSRLTSVHGLGAAGGPAFSTPFAANVHTSSYRLRAGYLTLRYSASAGRTRGSLGLRQYPVGGTGNLEGRIYLDANDNGVRDPAEQGVNAIIVVLDGIQAVRTDPAGYYRFEGVSDGPHRITLNTDMLPLPWVIEAPDKRQAGVPFAKTVDIGVRSTTTLDIAARRE